MTIPRWQAELIGDILDGVTDKQILDIIIGAHLLLEVDYGKGVVPCQENFAQMMEEKMRTKAKDFNSIYGKMIREYLETNPQVVEQAIAYLHNN